MISKQTRVGLFFIALVLFAVGGTLTAFYSLGWRVNFGTLAVAKTGALFFETYPRGVTIKIDDKSYADKSNFLQSGTLILNLAPAEYRVEIHKEGYRTWQKSLAVLPELVTEAVNIFLVPENLNTASTSLSAVKGEIVEVAEKGNEMRVLTHDAPYGAYYLYLLNASSPPFAKNVNNELKKFVASPVVSARFAPGSKTRLIVETRGGIYAFDPFASGKPKRIVSGAHGAWSASPSKIFYFASSTIYAADIDGSATSAVFATSSLSVSRIAPSRSENNLAFSDKNGVLFFLPLSASGDMRAPIRIATSTRDFAFSPNGDILAFFNGGSRIRLYFTEDIERGLRQKKGDRAVLGLPYASDIAKIAWHDDNAHLFIFAPSQGNRTTLSFVETDYRAPVNETTLLKDTESVYAGGDARVFFVKSGTLWYLDMTQ